MSTRTIEPIHIVLPNTEGGYYRFADLPRLIADVLYPEDPDADEETQELQWMRHGWDGVATFKEDFARAAGLTEGEPGYLHVDVKYLPQMADEPRRRYLFVAIDRATRWVFVAIKPNRTAKAATAFLAALHRACPCKIQRLLTDNGKEFTDRLFASRERQPSGHHEFDLLCQTLGIEHRLTPPRRPQTNGMVERFNGRIADVLNTHRFHDAEDLASTLTRYVRLYNQQFPQSVLQGKTPMQTMNQWYTTHPDLFHHKPYDHTGLDS